MSPRYVVDASVVAAAFVTEAGTDAAVGAIARIEDQGSEAHAPDLLLYEVANALLKRVRRDELSITAALDGIRRVAALPLLLHDPRQFSAPALSLAAAYDLTAYDAAYLAVGVMLGAPIVTLDSRLRDQAEAAGLAALTAAELLAQPLGS